MNDDLETTEPSTPEPLALGYASPRSVNKWPSRRLLLILWILLVIGFSFLAVLPALFTRRGHLNHEHCRSTLRSLGVGLQFYHADNGAYPPDLNALLDDGVILGYDTCPTFRRSGKDGFGYHYVTGLNANDPPDWILAHDDPANHTRHDRINVLYLDGHTESLSKREFDKERARFLEAFQKQRGRLPMILPPGTP